MLPFEYVRCAGVDEAVAALAGAGAVAVAGGTELLNLMRGGVLNPAVVVDINALPLTQMSVAGHSIRIGALARLSDVADDSAVAAAAPAIRQAILKSASHQIRNVATIGGNLLQRTRCPHFRAEHELPCNKRTPGSGCAATVADMRNAAILHWTDTCRATHPSDLAVVLAMLGTTVTIRNAQGSRGVPISEFYVLPDTAAERDTVVDRGDLVTGLEIPANVLSRHSVYLKVRERSSYEFALVSVAVGLDVQHGAITDIRIAAGGVAPVPLRLGDLEQKLLGCAVDDLASLKSRLATTMADARTTPTTLFKVELTKRAVVRAVQAAGHSK